MNATPVDHLPTRVGWVALRIVLLLEVVGGAWLLWNVAGGFFAASDEPLGGRLSLLLAVAIWWGWIAITAWGAWTRRASWVRGSAITIHVLLFAAATGILQGLLGPQTTLGLELLVLALVGFVAAVLAKPDAPAELTS
ncbi:hypothetical protein [Leucobacter chromiireducens]|uniref:hypothetical protein n=1 Tax=Leucobacter chromiireducens TaxID=283877 RepID=UPI000F62E686|nr:hypothetical protein [Leucobacter chromiireducens]